jgi:hypothetical protein
MKSILACAVKFSCVRFFFSVLFFLPVLFSMVRFLSYAYESLNGRAAVTSTRLISMGYLP